MDLRNPPIVLMVFVTSFLAAPLIYTLDKLVVMEDQKWVFAAGVVTLPLFGMLVAIFVRRSQAKNEMFFYVWSIFSFTAVVDLFIGLELDGYVKGFMEFYLREGEPYLRSSYGTMINWYDGTAHFSMYLVLIGLLCSGQDYRQFGLYWVGSIMNSMIVFMPGNFTGNKGIKWSYLLNVPYVYFPIHAGVKYIREGMRVNHKQTGEKSTWQKVTDSIFGVWFVFAMVVAGFRMISCMGCKDHISKFYVTEIEPYLMDPTQYGKTQALCYFYYYIPFYAGALYSLILPNQNWALCYFYYYIPFYAGALCSLIFLNQHWVKDWSLLHAGASMQGQFVYIASCLKWRTPAKHIVPDTFLHEALCYFYYYIPFYAGALCSMIFPNQHWALCYFYYYIPFYAGALCSLIFPNQHWVKDWSLIHAGASMQGQFVYIASSLKWRTPAKHIVPDTFLAQSIFWSVNLSLLIMPHLFALYCNWSDINVFLRKFVLDKLGLVRSDESPKPKSKPVTSPRNGPVTRLQKKNM